MADCARPVATTSRPASIPGEGVLIQEGGLRHARRRYGSARLDRGGGGWYRRGTCLAALAQSSTTIV